MLCLRMSLIGLFSRKITLDLNSTPVFMEKGEREEIPLRP